MPFRFLDMLLGSFEKCDFSPGKTQTEKSSLLKRKNAFMKGRIDLRKRLLIVGAAAVLLFAISRLQIVTDLAETSLQPTEEATESLLPEDASESGLLVRLNSQ
jgi:hypothetical protein